MKKKRTGIHYNCCAYANPYRESTVTDELQADSDDNKVSGRKRLRDTQNKYSNDNGTDPIYSMFLDHLREYDKSYILEMIDGDHGPPIFIKYDEENESCDLTKLNSNLLDKPLSHYVPPETEKFSGNISDRMGTTNRKASDNGISNPNSVQTITRHPKSKEHSLVDDSYQKFLSHLKLQDGAMVLEWQPGISVRYEESKGTSISLEGLPTESTLCSGGQELIPYRNSPQDLNSQLETEEDDSTAVLAHSCGDSFQYKEKLIEVLSRPFDQNEYEELLKEATERKPLTRLKHLRSMSISYATKEEGQSYLDHHPDFERQLKDADREMALILLRGFFFWLKNLSHEGAFMPWISLPSSSEKLLTNGYELMPLETDIEEI